MDDIEYWYGVCNVSGSLLLCVSCLCSSKFHRPTGAIYNISCELNSQFVTTRRRCSKLSIRHRSGRSMCESRICHVYRRMHIHIDRSIDRSIAFANNTPHHTITRRNEEKNENINNNNNNEQNNTCQEPLGAHSLFATIKHT